MGQTNITTNISIEEGGSIRLPNIAHRNPNQSLEVQEFKRRVGKASPFKGMDSLVFSAKGSQHKRQRPSKSTPFSSPAPV